MPKCYYCGKDFPHLTQCSHCKQLYCENHSEPGFHDCPYVPIQNPYEMHSNSLSSSSETSPNYSENLIPSSLEGDPSESVYTDGSYYWHRKPGEEVTPDLFRPCIPSLDAICFNASALNSSVYRLFDIDTSYPQW